MALKKTTIEIMHEEIANYDKKDSGREKKAFETAVRSFIAGRRFYGLKPQGKIDIRYKKDGLHYNCEIKTACGEIDLTSPYKRLIYAPMVDINKPAEEQAFVFTREEWLEFVNGYTGRGQFIRYDAKRGHKHIQSFYVSETVRPKASKPIRNYIDEVLATKPTVKEYFNK